VWIVIKIGNSWLAI